MAIRIVRLGSPRAAGKGIRIGTVRRPPRGVPKSEYARRDFYDVWLPNLSPPQELMKEAKAANDEASWALFKKKFRSQVNEGETEKILDLLATLSHQTHFSLGCYCEDENHCHRSVLKELLAERRAKLVYLGHRFFSLPTSKEGLEEKEGTPLILFFPTLNYVQGHPA